MATTRVYMKKLLIITDMYPYEANPVSGVFVRQQVNYLKDFYQVKVVAAQFTSSLKISNLQDNGIELISIQYPQLRFFPLNIINYCRYALPHIRKVIAEWKPDIIHVHDCRHVPELISLHRVLKAFPGKTFLSAHNTKTLPNLAETNLHALIYKATLKAAYAHFTHIFFVNERLQRNLAKLVPLKSSSVIGNALPEDREVSVPEAYTQWLGKDEFKIIAAGNLVKTKGFCYLLHAVENLIKQGQSIQLMIVGEGPERASLEALIRKLKLHDQIMLTGALDNAILRSLYKGFDAFVLPSFSETFGIVYLEAMQAGLPVVGIKGQGIDGIITEGISGLLAKPKQVTDLIEKILWLMENPEARQTMAAKGKKLVEESYRMPQLIARIREQYEA